MKKNRNNPTPFKVQGLCYRFIFPIVGGFMMSAQDGIRKRMTYQEIQDLQNS